MKMAWIREHKYVAGIFLIAFAVALHISAALVDIHEAVLTQTLEITNIVEIAEIVVGTSAALVLKRWF